MEMQLQAMTAANCMLHYNLTFVMLHSDKFTLCSANQQLEELTSWLIQPCRWQDTSEEQPSSGGVSYTEYGSSFSSLDNNESSSRGNTHSSESSICDESAVCGSTDSKESACDSDDGTDGGRCTCLPLEQWPPCNEDPEDGEWVFIPEGGSDEEHQLGEDRAACSHTFAAAEVNPNLTTTDDPETPSGPSPVLELPRSIEISSDDQSQSSSSRDSSQDCGPRDDRVDASCQTDFEDCDVRSSLQETSATTCFAKGDGECAPYDLLLPDMLPYLSVTDLLNWCQLSRQTRSSEALIAHVAEMGSMERPASVVDFVKKCLPRRGRAPDAPRTVTFRDDTEQKIHHCRRWCKAFAQRKTHCAESRAQCTVDKNLQSLLRHCLSADASVAASAQLVVMNYAYNAAPSVQQRIAGAALELMGSLVQSGIQDNMSHIWRCVQTLVIVLRSLSVRERQNCVSLFVKLLLDPVFPKRKVLEKLKMLWIVDDDPRRTYADALQQLLIAAKSTTEADVQRELYKLVTVG
ncbi:unnamed protein product [Symbiodinium sp. CCMP2592]|nr:unnamed protein product [Symbiodinium sp. CCMP2592]